MNGKLISADRLIQFVENWGKHHGREEAADSFLYAIHNAPAVDAVEVVRCRQCCFGVKKRERGEVVTYCGLFWDMKGVLDPNEFCSYGKEINDAKTD